MFSLIYFAAVILSLLAYAIALTIPFSVSTFLFAEIDEKFLQKCSCKNITGRDRCLDLGSEDKIKIGLRGTGSEYI
jgi:hypothetical protein